MTETVILVILLVALAEVIKYIKKYPPNCLPKVGRLFYNVFLFRLTALNGFLVILF